MKFHLRIRIFRIKSKCKIIRASKIFSECFFSGDEESCAENSLGIETNKPTGRPIQSRIRQGHFYKAHSAYQ